MYEELTSSINDSILAIEQLKKKESLKFIDQVAQLLTDCFSQGNKVLIAGNGGSLCDASHFAEELSGFFRHKRKAFPALALSDPGHMSCVANDIGFEWVFARAIEAHGKKGDVFIGLTTSGNSPNILQAVEKAKNLNLHTVTFLGKNGGQLLGLSDYELLIENFNTSDRIQEAHMTALHLIVQLIESKLCLNIY